MRYQFIFTEWFDRNLKHLGRHNPTLRQDLESFLNSFDAEAHPIVPGTSGARKARMKAKGRGKRGGIGSFTISCSAMKFGLSQSTTR